MMGGSVPRGALASLMARLSEPLLSSAFSTGSATLRLSLAFALGLTAFFATRLPAQAAEPDPWFGRDKVMHLTVSFALPGPATRPQRAAPSAPASGSCRAPASRCRQESPRKLYDQYGGRGFSWRDLTWDAVGTATGTLVAWLVDRYLF